MLYCFVNEYSKELSDYGVGIHRRKEDFLKKKKRDVMYLVSYIGIHKEMSKIIITFKK